jgi:hypothetical protein
MATVWLVSEGSKPTKGDGVTRPTSPAWAIGHEPTPEQWVAGPYLEFFAP